MFGIAVLILLIYFSVLYNLYDPFVGYSQQNYSKYNVYDEPYLRPPGIY
jgi:hypothetical protein